MYPRRRFKGQGLEKLARLFTDVDAINNRLSRRYDEVFLEQFAYMDVINDELKQDQQKLAAWFADMEQRSD